MSDQPVLFLQEVPYTCPQGHLFDGPTSVSYRDPAAKVFVERSYCPVCWVDWIARTFPAFPAKSEPSGG